MNDFVPAAAFTAMVTKALAGGQTDPFPRAMQDIALIIRTSIESNRTNVVSATANAIPPELHWVCGFLILEKMQTRLTGYDLNEDQRTQIKRAWDLLKDIREKRFVVSIPTDPLTPTEVQLGPPATIVTRSCRTVNAWSMRGI